MTPQAFAEHMHARVGPHVKSVILFGSRVAGDHAGKRSNDNVLIVLDQLGLDELRALSLSVRAWVKSGNPPPLLLTPESLREAARIFPIEIADLQDSRHVLFGDDLVQGLTISHEHLRFQLAHELSGKLMQLRARYLVLHGKPRELTEVMIRSLSTFLVLCRGVLRLYQPSVPQKKIEALAALSRHLPVQTEVFETLMELKRGRRIPGLDPEQLFAQYLGALERIIAAIDLSPKIDP